MIAKEYLTGWFFIDLLAIVPFDLIMGGSSDMNSMVRFARLGRLYKLAKLTKLIRVFKMLKTNKLMKLINDLLKVSPGTERLFLFGMVSMIGCHIFACLWIMLPQYVTNEEDPELYWKDSWLEPFVSKNYTDSELYTTSFYWTITTITTVGYGDIHGVLPGEKLFNSLVMIIGVILFTFANGSLTSILQNYDEKNKVLSAKI